MIGFTGWQLLWLLKVIFAGGFFLPPILVDVAWIFVNR
jgi:hypothetical protein